MRLDKRVSNQTDFSRNEVKRLLRAGVIEVNGQPASAPNQRVSDDDEIIVEGVMIGVPAPRYFMLHKPVGVVCAQRDSEHAVVQEFIDEPRQENLQVVGRLDLDTTGMVLLSDDGQWAHQVMSPRHLCKKTYRVTCVHPIGTEAIAQFAEGVQLNQEEGLTRPATLELISENEAWLTITEGKYHQVKRMFAAIGNRVEALHRAAVGGVALDETLEPGEYRALSDAEAQQIIGAGE